MADQTTQKKKVIFSVINTTKDKILAASDVVNGRLAIATDTKEIFAGSGGKFSPISNQFKEMPQASAAFEGIAITYVGETTTEYQQCHLYICKKIGSNYIWKDTVGIIGEVKQYAGKTVPSGWLICNGQAVSRTEYSELFNIIGTMYGSGNGSTTFNLPDFTNAFAEGAKDTSEVSKKKDAGLPNIIGRIDLAGPNRINWNQTRFYTHDGAFAITGNWQGHNETSDKLNERSGGENTPSTVFSAAKGECGTYTTTSFSGTPTYKNNVYGKSTTVQPKSVCMLFIIKY